MKTKMKTKIDFTSKEVQKAILILGEQLFEHITNLPESVRPKPEKERTGIRILAREVGQYSRNFCVVTVREPSMATLQFIFEKADRSYFLGYPTSGIHANPKKNEYNGSISFNRGDGKVQFSVSGLTEDEDITCAVIILHRIMEVSMDKIQEYVGVRSRSLYGVVRPFPDAYQKQDHYLSKLLKEYDMEAT